MQSILLSTVSDGRDNNFNFLRVVAASLVIVTHAFGVTGHGEWEPLARYTGLSLGSWAVDIFFVTSGFLVCKSWFNRRNALNFLYARVLRIYPALWVSTLLVLLILGPIYTQLSLSEYFTHLDTLKYALENTTLILKGVMTTLPGVFEQAPSNDVNAPLWTLPYEMKMYLLLGLLGWAGLMRHKVVVAGIAIVSGIAFSLIYTGQLPEFTNYLEAARFTFFFYTGAAFYLYRSQIQLSVPRFFLTLTVAIIALLFIQDEAVRRLILAFSTPIWVFSLAYLPTGPIRAYNRLGDYSYGIYIYGYPIQQIVYSTLGSSVLLNFLVSMILCVGIAAISWHFLEKRALRWPMPKWYSQLSLHPWFIGKPVTQAD